MINPIKAAVYSKLNGTSAVTSLLSSATAIYWQIAGESAARPYIVFYMSSGGDTQSVPNELIDVRIGIKAVAVSGTAAGNIASAIRDALNNQELNYGSGWKHIDCRETGLIDFVETVDRVQYYHSGGLYRLRASKR